MTHAAGPRRSADEQARLDAALTDLFERRISFNQVLGLRVTQLLPQVRLAFDMRPELVGHYLYGRLHGGVISATLDATGGFALMVAIGEKHADETTEQIMHRFARMGTIDLRIDYLRPGIGQHFVASAEVTRLGGRVGSTLMRLVNEQGTLVATGAAAYMIS
ncbi:thioesterase family protein [Calidifontimicrobium sp. SYSU G02091]|uniref:thioesterase family protein n=1 Tax=Calidifontimicrobium sp. SYSU G02091 TaxID=2926421 RepID=UPI001F5350EF|nr:thioesterase family protein [Calidifontimicrobium sp. SYSU G02091]MCI1192840.1 thioesterase family protein [Calidifontimicrobium sp. SYSU G02091]